MRAYPHGRVSGPAVAVIGVWDPLLPAHTELLARLRERARERSLCSLVIALDPDPVRYLHSAAELPVYNSASARVSQMLRCGIDGVLRIRFFRRDIEATAADLFAAVDPFARIAELWLGVRQTLGRMEAGNFATIARLAELRAINVLRLPHRPLETRQVRELLRCGRLLDAALVVGRPPVQGRPRSGTLRVAWCPGPYRARPIAEPNVAAGGELLDLRLTPHANGVHTMKWPDARIRYLAFVAGPADLAADASATNPFVGAPSRENVVRALA